MGQAELVSPAQPAGSGDMSSPPPAAVRSRTTSAWDAEDQMLLSQGRGSQGLSQH